MLGSASISRDSRILPIFYHKCHRVTCEWGCEADHDTRCATPYVCQPDDRSLYTGLRASCDRRGGGRRPGPSMSRRAPPFEIRTLLIDLSWATLVASRGRGTPCASRLDRARPRESGGFHAQLSPRLLSTLAQTCGTERESAPIESCRAQGPRRKERRRVKTRRRPSDEEFESSRGRQGPSVSLVVNNMFKHHKLGA